MSHNFLCFAMSGNFYYMPDTVNLTFCGALYICILLYTLDGEGNGTPLQYSCLENPMGRGAWWAAVHGVCYESDTTEWLHFHFSLSCIGEGNGNPLLCSFLENPRDRGAWWAAVFGVTQSRTWLKWLSSSSSSIYSWDFSGELSGTLIFFKVHF